MGAPDLFSTFVNDRVLMRVDVVGEGIGRGGPEVGEEFVFGVEGDDGEREFLKGGGRWGRRGDDGDRCLDDGGREVLNRDIREWDAVNDFLELEVDVGVLGFDSGGVLKLRA